MRFTYVFLLPARYVRGCLPRVDLGCGTRIWKKKSKKQKRKRVSIEKYK